MTALALSIFTVLFLISIIVNSLMLWVCCKICRVAYSMPSAAGDVRQPSSQDLRRHARAGFRRCVATSLLVSLLGLIASVMVQNLYRHVPDLPAFFVMIGEFISSVAIAAFC